MRCKIADRGYESVKHIWSAAELPDWPNERPCRPAKALILGRTPESQAALAQLVEHIIRNA